MTSEQEIRKSFLDQAAICGSMGSSFMELLLSGLAEQLDSATKTSSRILNWKGDPAPQADALALRLAGGLHGLAKSNKMPELSKWYAAPEAIDQQEFLKVVMMAIRDHDDELLPWLDFAPQTNEVARSSIVYAGLCEVAERYGMPINLLELGSSGGLNLNMDLYEYQFGDTRFGKTTSELKLAPQWQGNLPPKISPEITSREGCDLNPISVTNPETASKLIAYLWPDQTERIERIEAAIQIAHTRPPLVKKQDAARWVADKLFNGLPENQITVLFHTIVWNYFPQETKAIIKEAMHAAGGEASASARLAWLSFEFDDDTVPLLKLQTWPDGDFITLAEADPHCSKIHWLQ